MVCTGTTGAGWTGGRLCNVPARPKTCNTDLRSPRLAALRVSCRLPQADTSSKGLRSGDVVLSSSRRRRCTSGCFRAGSAWVAALRTPWTLPTCPGSSGCPRPATRTSRRRRSTPRTTSASSASRVAGSSSGCGGGSVQKPVRAPRLTDLPAVI